MEFFLYFLVGTSEEYDRDEIIELFMTGDYAEILFAGGWLSILGPSIVLALYVFGHRVSINILIIQKKVTLNVSKMIWIIDLIFTNQ